MVGASSLIKDAFDDGTEKKFCDGASSLKTSEDALDDGSERISATLYGVKSQATLQNPFFMAGVQLVALKSVNDDRQEIRDETSHLTKEFNERKQLNKEKIYQLERTATMDVERSASHFSSSFKTHL